MVDITFTYVCPTTSVSIPTWFLQGCCRPHSLASLVVHRVNCCCLTDRLYQSGAAAVTRRQAKQDEMLVSIDGSPVMSFNEPAKVLLVNKSQVGMSFCCKKKAVLCKRKLLGAHCRWDRVCLMSYMVPTPPGKFLTVLEFISHFFKALKSSGNLMSRSGKVVEFALFHIWQICIMLCICSVK